MYFQLRAMVHFNDKFTDRSFDFDECRTDGFDGCDLHYRSILSFRTPSFFSTMFSCSNSLLILSWSQTD